MQPILFTIGGTNIQALSVFAGVSFLCFFVLLWVSLKGKIQTFNIFDVAFGSVFFAILVGRIVYIIQNFQDFTINGWYFLPLRDSASGIVLFNSAPWNFFAVWDGDLVKNLIPIALAATIFAISFFNKEISASWDVIIKIWAAFIPSYIILVIGFLLDGTYIGQTTSLPIRVVYEGYNETRLAIQLIEVVVLVALMIIYFNKTLIEKYPKILVFLFPVAWSVAEIVLSNKTEGRVEILKGFDVLQTTWILFIAIFVGALYLSSLHRKRAKNQTDEKRHYSQANLKTSRNPYDFSFSNYKSRFDSQMTYGEKIKQAKNRIKREIT